VKLKAICIVGGQNGTAPSKLRVYINRDDLDFSAVSSMPAVQEWDLQDNSAGLLEYPTQVSSCLAAAHANAC
jgi:PITH domain